MNDSDAVSHSSTLPIPSTNTNPDLDPANLQRALQRIQSGQSALELVYATHARWPLPPLPPPSQARAPAASASTPSGSSSTDRPRSTRGLRVFILDASFNPPTRAHLALAQLTAITSSSRDTQLGKGGSPPVKEDLAEKLAEEARNEDEDEDGGEDEEDEEEADARLLLLSARNADKTLTPGDATLAQRLRMMVLLAQEIGAVGARTDTESGLDGVDGGRDTDAEGVATSSNPLTQASGYNANTAGKRKGRGRRNMDNVAVALIDAPTFVAKASILRSSLETRLQFLSSPSSSSCSSYNTPPPPPSHSTSVLKSSPSSPPAPAPAPTPTLRLTFIMGFDTLARVFAPRYYPPGTPTAMYAALGKFFQPPPAGDGAAVICAWRGAPQTAQAGVVNVPGDAPHSLTAGPTAGDSGKTTLGVEDREGKESDEVRATLKMAEPYIAAGHVSFASLTDWEMLLSSSAVRAERKKNGEAWLEMVPNSVAEFIRQNELYTNKPSHLGHTL